MRPQINRMLAANAFDIREPTQLVVLSSSLITQGLVVVTRRYRRGDWIFQGRTNSSGTLVLVGLHNLDMVRVQIGPGAFETTVQSALTIVSGAEILQIILPV